MRRNPPAHRSFFWISLQSRRKLRRHVKQWVQKFLTTAFFFFSSPRGAMVRKLLMHAVPRMRLRSSLSVVQHLFCRLVCFFSTRSWFFSGHVSFNAW